MHCGLSSRIALLLLTAGLPLCGQAIGVIGMDGRVVDDNGAPVPGVRVIAAPAGTTKPPSLGGTTTDAAGAFRLTVPDRGTWAVFAQEEGFFLFVRPDLIVDRDTTLEIHLSRLKEMSESLDVRYSPPVIDPEHTGDTKALQSPAILNVPYPAGQDYRSALPLMSGAVQDNSGQVHFNGGETNETNYRLNGFDVSDPATGGLTTRLNVDTVQTLEWEASRYSPEKGKGSAGTLEIRTQMGDDHWRFGGTNFIPGLAAQNGLYVNHWSPRATVSGPIKKGRGWFHNAFDAYYTANTIPQLPGGQNRNNSLTTTDLTRFQWNLSDSQILSGSFLINLGDDRRAGLSFLNPAQTTTNSRHSLMLGTIKDQLIIGGGVLEFGFANTNAYNRSAPQGDQPYVVTPFGASGNYFRDDKTWSSRQEWLINGFVKPIRWHGSHQIEVGADVERSNLNQTIYRHEFTVVRADNSIVRSIQFAGSPQQFRTNVEAYSYVVDRWSPLATLTVEGGFRTQWDEYTGGAPPAPRLAAAWAPKLLGGLKLSAGWGVFYDAATLGMLALSQEQTSVSTYYAPDGTQVGVPVQSMFVLRPHDVRLPRFAMSSFTAERKLPLGLNGRVNLISRQGSRGFSFEQTIENPSTNLYVLDNVAREKYRAAEFEVRRTFLAKYQWFASYTRSEARSTAVIGYSIENPLLTPQTGGPLPWDAPNRVVMWGWAPVSKQWFPRLLRPIVGETDFQVLGDFQTGFPFSAVTETGYIAGQPGAYRFPDYLTLNVALERKFPFHGYMWAFRGALVNSLDRQNANVVNNDFNSPDFMAFQRGQARAVNVRLRFIGRVK
jgi:hypothetical protein